ncbi:MAG: hypothetical protein LBE71_06320 [Dysgonamonadaceae bacterium]|nr:hypothetical protein [Dysgonamonadaceae bacterium]
MNYNDAVGELDCHAAIAARNDEVGSQSRTRHCEGKARSNPEKTFIFSEFLSFSI